MLLPFLLRQHKTWKNVVVRLFAIAQLEVRCDCINLWHLAIQGEGAEVPHKIRSEAVMMILMAIECLSLWPHFTRKS